jgi:hypothetical protein
MAEDFRTQRRAGLVAVIVGAAVGVGVWFAVDRGLPPLAGLDALDARMVFTLKCFAVAVLFCLAMGVEAVAHERLVSPAFDPLTGAESRRLRINQRYLQNTLEQTPVFAAAIFGLAAYARNGSEMREVAATTVVWVLGRWAFWLGYHKSAALRGLGAASMILSLFLLVYVAARFGSEIFGSPGAVAAVALFLAFEALLIWSVRRPGEGQ